MVKFFLRVWYSTLVYSQFVNLKQFFLKKKKEREKCTQIYMFKRIPYHCFGVSHLKLVVKSPPASEETRAWFLSWKDPLEKEMTTHSSMDRGTWWATVHGVAKSQTRLSIWACYILLLFRSFSPYPCFVQGEGKQACRVARRLVVFFPVASLVWWWKGWYEVGLTVAAGLKFNFRKLIVIFV